ncbi:MAG: PEP-CTERM sorting domain-containing protein [Phycisphaeraceae bacterium]
MVGGRSLRLCGGLLSVVLGFQAAAGAAPTDYIFANVVDSGSSFSSLSPYATINNNDIVAFRGLYPDFSSGIYFGPGVGGAYGPDSGQLVTAVVESSVEPGEFSQFGTTGPAINNAGQFAFWGFKNGVGGGIYRSNGPGTLTTIVDPTRPSFNAFLNNPTISDSGMVAFNAGDIAMGDGADTVTVALRTSAGPTGTLHSPDHNSGLTFTFAATLSTGTTGIYWLQSEPRLVVALAVSGSEFSGFGLTPAINEHDTVAFRGILAGGGGGIYVDEYPIRYTIAESSDGYSNFADPAINANGDVAFVATHLGKAGIFTGPDAEVDKVIGVGDPLFGSTLLALSATPMRGQLNDHGDLVFWYRLTNGREGLAVAYYVPEPTTALMLGVGSLLLATRRRMHMRSQPTM